MEHLFAPVFNDAAQWGTGPGPGGTEQEPLVPHGRTGQETQMERKWKIGLLGLTLVALAGAGVASAHGGFDGWDGKAVEGNCTDDMTVAECRDAVQDAHQQEQMERCTTEYDADFCTGLQSLHEQQRAETDALLEEYGIDGPVHFRPERPSEPPEAVCTEDTTVAECREAHRAAMTEARHDACAEEYGEDFCTAFFDLQEEHQAERQTLFDEYGYEMPAHGPGFGGPGGRGPGGPGGHHGPGRR